MEVIIKPKAQKALSLIATFVEERNTPQSGLRYIEKFASKIKIYAKENVQYSLCNNITLSTLGYSCITISKWVVVFKIQKQKFVVYRIIWGALLN